MLPPLTRRLVPKWSIYLSLWLFVEHKTGTDVANKDLGGTQGLERRPHSYWVLTPGVPHLDTRTGDPGGPPTQPMASLSRPSEDMDRLETGKRSPHVMCDSPGIGQIAKSSQQREKWVLTRPTNLHLNARD
ncbi:hypothetical protein GW17_00010550 [Ensete ventricosum]|nr:hypothetical protein GW17_00010550 [Ensete ventricosum]